MSLCTCQWNIFPAVSLPSKPCEVEKFSVILNDIHGLLVSTCVTPVCSTSNSFLFCRVKDYVISALHHSFLTWSHLTVTVDFLVSFRHARHVYALMLLYELFLLCGTSLSKVSTKLTSSSIVCLYKKFALLWRTILSTIHGIPGHP